MKTLYAAAVFALSTLTLAACSGSEEAAPAAEENPTGLEISNARLILPAVAGNPAAVYFDLKNGGTRAVAVRKADIADAGRTEMHDVMEYDGKMTMNEMGPTTVPQGETMKFEPGAKHVMAFDLSPELKAGAKTELTLTVAGGDKASFEVPVEAADAER